MAATGRTLSPGGALLRASRMFSLPSAIPAPPGDFQAATNYNSDTATAAFPTLQTVTVPETFRQRGDWGFKRNLPLRSTAKTSTPFLRVKEVDSLEQVTDFNSAADHAVSLQKFQNMNLAISLPHKYDQFAAASFATGQLESVFEEQYDFTAIDDAEKVGKAGHKRWKFKGPWLANLTQGEFQAYIKKEVRGRRAEFRDFLRRELAPKLTMRARQHAMDKGLDLEIPDVRPEDITEEQLLDELRELREGRQRLFDLVEKFLDLAPIEPPSDVHLGGLTPGESRLSGPSPYASSGPPVTHPSAGLSYLRTDAFLENHPVYGPQAKKKPIKARIMISSARQSSATGVGGFISTSPVQAYRNVRGGLQQDRGDFKAPGGAKAWVNVVSAHINSNGRPVINVENADKSAIMVQEEMQGEKQLYHQKVENVVAKAMEMRGPRTSRGLKGNSVFKNSSPSSYGFRSVNM